jgi:hypothetical protein
VSPDVTRTPRAPGRIHDPAGEADGLGLLETMLSLKSVRIVPKFNKSTFSTPIVFTNGTQKPGIKKPHSFENAVFLGDPALPRLSLFLVRRRDSNCQ